MRGHIITEERFMHQGIDHHLFVTGIEGVENECRFEVRRIPSGSDQSETEFEKTIDFSARLAQSPDVTLEQLIQAELIQIKQTVFEDEDLHTHDP